MEKSYFGVKLKRKNEALKWDHNKGCMPLSSFQKYNSKLIFKEKCHTTTLLRHNLMTHGLMDGRMLTLYGQIKTILSYVVLLDMVLKGMVAYYDLLLNCNIFILLYLFEMRIKLT